jgi:excisionase family DNA binding protein
MPRPVRGERQGVSEPLLPTDELVVDVELEEEELFVDDEPRAATVPRRGAGFDSGPAGTCRPTLRRAARGGRVRPADRLRLLLADDVVDALEELIEERIDAREELVDTETAADLLGISEAAVRMRVDRGTLQAVRTGRRLRIPRKGVLAAAGDGYPDPLNSGAAPRQRPAP